MEKIITSLSIIFLILFSNLIAKAQQITFMKTFETSPNKKEEAFSMQEIKGHCNAINYTGYVLVTGQYSLIRTDLNGNIIWTKQFDYSNGGFSDYVQETSDCGFIVAGSILDSNNHRNYNLIKTDANGNLIWNKQYIPSAPDTLFNKVYNYTSNPYWGKIGVKTRQTDDQGYILLGQIISPINNATYFHLIKTDSLGQVEWTKYYDSNYFPSNNMSNHVIDIELAGSGTSRGYILYGQEKDSTLTHNYLQLIRLDNSGAVLWSKKYLEPFGNAGAGAIAEANDKGFILTGYALYEPMVMKVDSSGNFEWFKIYNADPCFGMHDFVSANSIKPTTDGNYIVGCCQMYSGDPLEAILLKIDSAGSILWSKSYMRSPGVNLLRGSEACSVIQTSDLGFAFCGGIGTDFFTINNDVFFVKTDSMGNTGCYDSLFLFCPATLTSQGIPSGDTLTVSVTNSSVTPIVQSIITAETTYCLSTNIEENIIIKNKFINPNITNGEIVIDIYNNQNYNINVYNELGRLILNKITKEKKSILNLENFSNGIYLVTFTSDSECHSEKIIIQH